MDSKFVFQTLNKLYANHLYFHDFLAFFIQNEIKNNRSIYIMTISFKIRLTALRKEFDFKPVTFEKTFLRFF